MNALPLYFILILPFFLGGEGGKAVDAAAAVENVVVTYILSLYAHCTDNLTFFPDVRT